MDRFEGSFGAYDDAEPLGLVSSGDYADEPVSEVPPSPVGQDERRMQVRAYNHWAALIGDGQFPDIADLAPETLDDFGPYGVLLDFGGKRGIDDPAIRFLGSKLAEECGGNANYRRLSEVPGRSLLSRITDHYLQILANKAPIGFEAEFTNERGAPVLYRGILLPWSSDGEAIDFIFGVINWKEIADAATAEALLDAIDEALEAPIPPCEGKDMDRMLDLSALSGRNEEGEGSAKLPMPSFGHAAAHSPAEEAVPLELVDEIAGDDESGDYDEDSADDAEWGAGFSGFGDEDTVYTVDYGELGLEDGEEGDDVDDLVDPLSDGTAELGLASLVSRSGRVKQSVQLPGLAALTAEPDSIPTVTVSYEPAPDAQPPVAVEDQPFAPDEDDDTLELDAAFEEPFTSGEVGGELELSDAFVADEDGFGDEADPEPAASTGAAEGADTEDAYEAEGLYDCLAAARELAQTARSSEDRGRKALYQAVGRAYDFSLEAAANPDDFAELLADNGLTVQDRAPMTPIVKLVFGADYDKTRLTEYATVLGFAHRTGVDRGALDKLIASAEGGLKGIVAAERQARKGDGGESAADPRGIRPGLARKLRKLEVQSLADLAEDGPEFALVMVRRTASGEIEVVGEVPEDVKLVEKAARKLLG